MSYITMHLSYDFKLVFNIQRSTCMYMMWYNILIFLMLKEVVYSRNSGNFNASKKEMYLRITQW